MKPRATVIIDRKKIGYGHPCFIIAEAGVNHNGRLALALRLVDAAVRAGADAVKFQSFQAGALAGVGAPTAVYQRQGGQRESQRDMLRRLELSVPMHHAILAHCRARKILFLSSPFDEASADFLESLPVPAFKIPSGELTNIPFLRHVARKGKPILLSTGMANLIEVKEAVKAVRGTGNNRLILLHCTSLYPTPTRYANLRALHTLAREFQVPVGFSDHTEGILVGIAAVARGACILEKHLTLDRALPGPDHRASLAPDVFAHLVKSIRELEPALGHGRKEPAFGERAMARVIRKSWVAAKELIPGLTLKKKDLRLSRPGTGLAPSEWKSLVGKRVRHRVSEGSLMKTEMVFP